MDSKILYSAIKSRDERFDGRFIMAVMTTGIYCRPVCPAPTPRYENVRFYPCVAAAAAAGFRPCLRCRPETSPGMPWFTASTLVARALKMITEGTLDESGVAVLAQRLNVSERHLRRLFDVHLGVSPIAIAQTRRLHYAKKLLDETGMPVTKIAFCAGFSSIRRFNAVFQEGYGKPPSAFRRVARKDQKALADESIHLALPYRPPFSWKQFQDYFTTRAIPGVEFITRAGYRRTVQVGDASGIIEVRPQRHHAALELIIPPALSSGVIVIIERVKRLFDLSADPYEIRRHLKKDPRLSAHLRKQSGLRVPGAWDPFETAVRAILGQRVSVKAATTLAGRLVRAYGEPLVIAEGRYYLFPRPEQLSRATLSGLGISGSRIEAIRALARAIIQGELAFSTSATLEEAVRMFSAIPGIGSWTAHYIAMRALGEPDAFPAGDLILRRALHKRLLSERALLAYAQAWRPWRAYAAMAIWTSVANSGI